MQVALDKRDGEEKNERKGSFYKFEVSSDSDSELSEDDLEQDCIPIRSSPETLQRAHRSFRDCRPVGLSSTPKATDTSAAATTTTTTSASASPPPSCTKEDTGTFLHNQFSQHVAQLSQPYGYHDSRFEEEYENLITQNMAAGTPIFVAQTTDTKRRNRYGNIFPLADTAVTLHPTLREGTELTSSYINANYVDGELSNSSSRCTKYIACQAPKAEFLNEFWIMIWDDNVPVISMMTRCQEGDKVKAIPYWIEHGGPVHVNVASEDRSAEYVKREIVLTREGTTEERKVVHVQFLAWPDFSVPSSFETLAMVLEETARLHASGNGPAVVHCSAGVGRAMTTISCLITRQKLVACMSNAHDKVHKTDSAAHWWEEYGCLYDPLDIKGTVARVRRQRHGAVVNVGQYEFIYRFILHYLKNRLITK